MLALITLALIGSLHDECTARFPMRVPRSARTYWNTFDPIFLRVAQSRNLPPALLKSIAWCETRLDPCAISATGAKGLMQFMGGTFSDVASAAGVSNPFDPEDAIEAAGVYVAALWNYWQGHIESVVASYNAGPGAVARARKRGRVVPAIAETEGYVACVVSTFNWFERGAATTQPPSERSWAERTVEWISSVAGNTSP
ncbi:MAG: lytic transglycosylase domain-containing protein [Deltaproteobacteria bacterium]|nr:lytic transglycosylase domain-containing protein [Deltaproteobacteria bacterium]